MPEVDNKAYNRKKQQLTAIFQPRGRFLSKVTESKDDLESWFPRFAALGRCLLVEADVELRKQVLSSIKATLLFEEILESSSLVRVAKQLQTIRFDACIFGPSLSAQNIGNFISKQRPYLLSEDCAFIAIVAKDRTMHRNLEAHASAVALWPSTKRSFMEVCVKGILRANEGTVWPGVKLNDDGQIIILKDGAWLTIPEEDPGQELTFPAAFKKVQSRMEITDEGSDAQILEAIKRLIEYINSPESKGSGEDPFLLFFENCVHDWQAELQYLSVREASRNLRRRLACYKENIKDGC